MRNLSPGEKEANIGYTGAKVDRTVLIQFIMLYTDLNPIQFERKGTIRVSLIRKYR